MRRKWWTPIAAGLALALLLAGCAVTLPSGDVVEVPVEAWTASASVEPGAQVEQEPAEAEPPPEPVLFTLLPLSEGEPLRARDIFAQVSPSVAHIDTPDGTGSAVLVDHGYLVSAAHVVWPYETVRAVFPDGTEFEELPVAAWDLMLDVALLGPIDVAETGITPLTFTDGSELPIGSDVYLVGYPEEFEDYPQPALGRGLLSRLREWSTTGLSMFQVDADVSGGQSGGAMVSEHGDLVGITNYRFSDSNSPMVTSAADVVPALTAMLAGEADTLADRRPLAGEAVTLHTSRLEDELAYHYFLLFAEAGDEVDLNVEGVGNPIVTIASLHGEVLDTSTPRAEQMSGVKTTIYQQGPYLVEVTQYSENRNAYTLTSSHPFYVVEDPDDDVELQVGDTYIGNLDNYSDMDRFILNLGEGDRIAVQVESLATDPFIAMLFESDSRTDTVYDDDSGPTGMFGLNARMVAEAQEAGEYLVLMGDATDGAAGGYILSVTGAGEEEMLTQTAYSEEYYLSSLGSQALYESAGLPFTMLYPASFEELYECDVSACFGGANYYIGIFEYSLGALAPSEKNADALMQQFRMGLESVLGDTQDVTRRSLRTHQGLEGRFESLTAFDESRYVSIFILFDEDAGAFGASYMADLGADANLDQIEDSVQRMYATIRLVDEAEPDNDASFYLQNAMRSAAVRDYESALEEVDAALALDGELAEAYAVCALIHWRKENYEEAMADARSAMELEPEKSFLMTIMAQLHWYQGEIEEALAQSDEAIALWPEDQSFYNDRALFRAAAGDYEGALAELARYEEMAEDGLPPWVLDTRAYVHLKFDALDEALADYEEVLDDDFQPAVALLGAGVTNARLGRMDEAMPLLEYGMEKFEEADVEVLDPQMAEVLGWAQEILASER